MISFLIIDYLKYSPLDTGIKLNVLCEVNLRPVFKGRGSFPDVNVEKLLLTSAKLKPVNS